MSPSEEPRRDETIPTLVKVFYRTGAFHCSRTTSSTPPHRFFPPPAVGTRLVFRLIYADARATPTRFVAKDLGSVVLGRGQPGAGGVPVDEVNESMKTLADARFIPGDYISCAILRPNELTGM
ncbi:hypothetical protein N0V88_001973 [Collariella sp. IMI 366227]|nr:hypothetical protein N0V88_001973 [Collariella sp. IMI 366227]